MNHLISLCYSYSPHLIFLFLPSYLYGASVNLDVINNGGLFNIATSVVTEQRLINVHHGQFICSNSGNLALDQLLSPYRSHKPRPCIMANIIQ